MKFKSAIIAFASLAAVASTVSPAAAGGLSLGLFNGNTGNGIVVAPSVDVGDVLSGNKILNGSLNKNDIGILSGILSGNETGLGLGILSGNGDGGKKRRH